MGILAVSVSVIAYRLLAGGDNADGEPSASTPNGKESSSSSSTCGRNSNQPLVKKATKVVLVVSPSLLNDGIPLQPLLSQYPELVVVLTPDVSRDEATMQTVNAQVPAEHSYKVIKCEKTIGVVHILKHLRPHLAILPHDIPRNTPSDISRFVGATTVLSDNPQIVHDEIEKLFFGA